MIQIIAKSKNKKTIQKMGKGPEKTLFFFQRRHTTGQQEHEIISTSLIIREPQTTT